MNIVGLGKRVRFYLDEMDRWHGRPTSLAILEMLRREGCAGGTALRGIAGFGAHSRIHTATLVDVTPNLPLVVEWVDTPERVERVLPQVSELIVSGLVTVEDVSITRYVHRGLRDIPEHLQVADVMSRAVVAVAPETPVRELVALLLHRIYRALPVVDAASKVVGLITNGDLIERGGLRGHLGLLEALDATALEHELESLVSSDLRARDIMTPDPITVRPDLPARAAARLMVTREVKRLPVVNSAGGLLGMLSRLDILRTVAEGFPAPLAARESDGPPLHANLVREVMSSTVPTVAPEAPLAEALDAVVSTPLSWAAVIDAERRVLGVITDAELIRRSAPGTRPGLFRVLRDRLRLGHHDPALQAALSEAHAQRATDVMVTPATTIRRETTVAEAARLTVVTRHKILPVVDESDRLVGMVDRADLLRTIGVPY